MAYPMNEPDPSAVNDPGNPRQGLLPIHHKWLERYLWLIAVMTFFLLILAFRRWRRKRRGPKPAVTLNDANAQRLERLEQGMEAIRAEIPAYADLDERFAEDVRDQVLLIRVDPWVIEDLLSGAVVDLLLEVAARGLSGAQEALEPLHARVGGSTTRGEFKRIHRGHRRRHRHRHCSVNQRYG